MHLQTMRPRDQAAPDDSVVLARQALQRGQQALMAGDGLRRCAGWIAPTAWRRMTGP